MIGKIDKIGEIRADTDNGKIYGRELVNLNNVKAFLKYNDDAGNTMIDDAIDLAKQKYKL